MNNYRFVGSKNESTNVLFNECTALGKMINGCFMIQIDQIWHPMSHGWHTANVDEWELVFHDE